MRQRKLATIARRRMFQAHESLRDINPFSRNGVFLLYHDSWFARARYIATFMAGDAAEARQSARRTLPSRALTNLPEQLRQAFLDWRRYRHALRRDTHTTAFNPLS